MFLDISKERICPDGIGHYRHYQGGSIYWTPQTGAHYIYGLIHHKWARLGWERGPNGYPKTDEEDARSSIKTLIRRQFHEIKRKNSSRNRCKLRYGQGNSI
ncbi:hypothetical protein E9840_01265 [Tissierella creatinini]|nr:hypothetical protein E9840_01265 [Tissierella creatinini]TJX64187.1 hypothetical protein E8P77_13085 [Soehngenia saccharolytica]